MKVLQVSTIRTEYYISHNVMVRKEKKIHAEFSLHKMKVILGQNLQRLLFQIQIQQYLDIQAYLQMETEFTMRVI